MTGAGPRGQGAETETAHPGLCWGFDYSTETRAGTPTGPRVRTPTTPYPPYTAPPDPCDTPVTAEDETNKYR